MNELTSIVIPVFNEKESLDALCNGIREVCEAHLISYEIVFVDDGSTDGSKEVIRELAELHHEIHAVLLRRNFGKSLALHEGIRVAKGEYIMTMDADLQDMPSEIPKFFDVMKQGYDVVSGWKQDRKDPLEKRLPSKFFNFITSKLAGISLHDFNCGFKLYKREALRNLPLYGEFHRFLPVFIFWRGYSIGEVQIQHSPRRFGKSKFGVERYFRGFFDLLSSLFLVRYFYKPMHFFSLAGGTVFGLGFLICLYLATLWFLGESIGTRPLLLLGALLMILGFQLITTGLLSEYINIRTYKSNSGPQAHATYITDTKPVSDATEVL